MKKVIWLTALLISMSFIVFGLLDRSVVLKPDQKIAHANRYYPDGESGPCEVIEDFRDGLDIHDISVTDIRGDYCKLVFRVGESDELYYADVIPLTALDYKSNMPVTIIGSIAAISCMAGLYLCTGKREEDTHTRDGRFLRHFP